MRPYPAQLRIIGDEEPEEGRICRLCDRKFMMGLYQDVVVEQVIQRQEDIISALTTLQMRVNEATHIHGQIIQLDEEKASLAQRSDTYDRE